MRRRGVLGAIMGAAVVVPIAGFAQHNEQRAHVGYLSPGARGNPDAGASQAFFDELARLGFAEGRNLEVLFEAFGNAPARLPEFASALVRASVDVIVAQGPEAAVRAARQATDTVPIVVIAINYDPVERGYAVSLAHPGGNVTGFFLRSIELAAKEVEFLRAMAPEATRMTVVWGTETAEEFAVAETAAKTQGLVIRSFKLGAPPYDYDAMFAQVAKEAPQLLLVLSTPAFGGHHREVAAATLRYRLPAMFRFRTYVEVGGLMSYGVKEPAMYRLAARYVGKILDGARPADLPIERADLFELTINLRTAKALGLTVPPTLLAAADGIIE